MLREAEQPTWNNTSCYQEYPKSSVVHAQTTGASFPLWLNSQCVLVLCLQPPGLNTRQQVQLQVLTVSVQSGLHVCYNPSAHSSNPEKISQTCLRTLCHFSLSPTLNSDFPLTGTGAAAVSVRLRLGGDKAA